ncbi:uncharacterized protein [Rutidosis leptorrhynchoides]|uniref:uncharacterized protein n=1 Tax=Rutidosis leptorrhynchoides TaxID=125765 RepID=UPI003A9A2052
MPTQFGNQYPNQMWNPYQMSMFQQPKKCTFKQFMDCKPPEYSGSPDPTVTINWLREMERVFEACQCEPELRVIFASRLLKNRAMVWWDSVISSIPKEQVSLITWEQFYSKVCEQYCTVYDIGRLKKEFMEMKMTEQMTIDEVIEQYMDYVLLVSYASVDMGRFPLLCRVECK